MLMKPTDQIQNRALTQTRMPAVYIAKYNRFLDTILDRINAILSKSYDPVRVKLQTPVTKKTKGKTNKRKTTKNKTKGKLKTNSENKMAEVSIARASGAEPSFVLISKNSNDVLKSVPESRVTGKGKRKRNKNKSKKNKTKENNKQSNKSQKARAILYGLSTIRRDGDVNVNMASNFTTVKTNFVIGPLTLRVEREWSKRELKSATATTTEMYGKLNLRIVHGGAATLHSIRVLQPKQVRVESKDNHDKTREYVWKRSSHIAHVVSSKLAKAAKSMLRPPPSA